MTPAGLHSRRQLRRKCCCACSWRSCSVSGLAWAHGLAGATTQTGSNTFHGDAHERSADDHSSDTHADALLLDSRAGGFRASLHYMQPPAHADTCGSCVQERLGSASPQSGEILRAALCHAGMRRLCSSAQRCSDVHGSGGAWSLVKVLIAEGSARGTCSTEPWPLVAADRPQASVLPVCILLTTRMVRLKWKNDLYGARRLVSSEIWCRDDVPRCM